MWLSTGDKKLTNACKDVLGDLYNNTVWKWLALGNNKMLITASMSLDVIVCVEEGCMSCVTLIMMPPLLTPDALSHLRAIWLSCTTGDGCNSVSQVSQKHNMVADFKLLSFSMSGNFAISDLTFNKARVI